MKKITKTLLLPIILLLLIIPFTGCEPCEDDIIDEKPVIYLYTEFTQEITVDLDFKGELTTTYPDYDNGWRVIADPDGTLYDVDTGREYYCLYWEGVSDVEYDFSKGFSVPGNETAEFLETALGKLGLSEKEANEFIIYWLPRMECNEYNLISFQTDAYTENAKLSVNPAPDTVIRVFMAWKALDKPVEIEAQELTAPEREGFTVVEWGGTEVEQTEFNNNKKLCPRTELFTLYL